MLIINLFQRKIEFLFSLQFVLLFFSSALELPDILWDPYNPMFDTLRCLPSSTKFNAKVYDVVPFLCPNPDLNSGYKENYKDYSFNIFMTSSQNDYINRDSTKAQHITDCTAKSASKNNRLSYFIVKHTEILKEISPTGGHKYEAGKFYYFFTTSNGSVSSLKNTIGEKKSMGIEVYICNKDDPCPGRERWDVCLYKSEPVVAERSNPFERSPTVMTAVVGAICFIVGVFLAVILRKFLKWYRKDRVQVVQTDEKNDKLLMPGSTQAQTYM